MSSPLPNLSEFHLHPGIALVTGAARGIGAAVATALAARGLTGGAIDAGDDDGAGKLN